MTPKFGPSELQRALARADVEQLRRDLEAGFKWHLWLRNGKDKSVPEADQGMYVDSLNYNRDGRLAICALAMAEYDDPGFLGLLAAGPLEDALTSYATDDPVPDDIVGRVLDEARRTPRFRWMLSGIWTYGCSAHVAEAVERAVGTVALEDPLPPRPWA